MGIRHRKLGRHPFPEPPEGSYSFAMRQSRRDSASLQDEAGFERHLADAADKGVADGVFRQKLDRFNRTEKCVAGEPPPFLETAAHGIETSPAMSALKPKRRQIAGVRAIARHDDETGTSTVWQFPVGLSLGQDANLGDRQVSTRINAAAAAQCGDSSVKVGTNAQKPSPAPMPLIRQHHRRPATRLASSTCHRAVSCE